MSGWGPQFLIKRREVQASSWKLLSVPSPRSFVTIRLRHFIHHALEIVLPCSSSPGLSSDSSYSPSSLRPPSVTTANSLRHRLCVLHLTCSDLQHHKLCVHPAARDLISTFQSTCSAYGLPPVTIPATQPTTRVVTPPPVATTPRITTPRVTTQVVTPPPVVVTTTPQVTTVTTTPATLPPPSVSEDTQTISQTVIRPVVTTRVSVTPDVSGTSLPGLTGGSSTVSSSGGVSALVVALSVILGVLAMVQATRHTRRPYII